MRIFMTGNGAEPGGRRKGARQFPGQNLARVGRPVTLAAKNPLCRMFRTLLSLLAASSAGAVTYSVDAVVNAPASTQFYVYREGTPGQLVLDNAHPVTSALQGTANAAGGNVELFATGDLDPNYQDPANGQPFATAPLVSLTGTANNAAFTLTSLNGTSWFTTTGGAYDISCGAANLATAWFNQFVDAVTARMTNAILIGAVNASRATIYDTFRDGGGFTELSDPNISHLYEDAGMFNIGLAGFIDQSPRLRAMLPDFAAFIPNGVQASEVVMVNGVARYSFSAVPSGVTLDDDFQSYTGTYVILAPAPPIPEPTAFGMVAVAGIAATVRRKRAQQIRPEPLIRTPFPARPQTIAVLPGLPYSCRLNGFHRPARS
jgi:hypothetical protein